MKAAPRFWLFLSVTLCSLSPIEAQRAEACSPYFCYSGRDAPTGPLSRPVTVPQNLPGMALDPSRNPSEPFVFNVGSHWLVGDDGQRVDLMETSLQPDLRQVRGPLRYVSFSSSLRPGVTYELTQSATVPFPCSSPPPGRAFTVSASSETLPTAPPMLSVTAPARGEVYTYGGGGCFERHQLPYVQLEVISPPEWSAWSAAVQEMVLIDGEPYSNYSIETEISGGPAPRMSERTIFARCGAMGSGGGVSEGTHVAQIALTIPGYQQFLTNSVTFSLSCALSGAPDAGAMDAVTVDMSLLPPPGDAGMPDAAPASSGGSLGGGSSSSSGCQTAGGLGQLWPLVLALLGMGLARRRRLS